MKFAVYLDCLPKKAHGDRKYQILEKYSQGVKLSNDEVILHLGNTSIPCDVAMLVGFVHEKFKKYSPPFVKKACFRISGFYK